jgi:hypothetical protein
MKRVFLDGAFFAEWAGSLAELAEFSEIAITRLAWHADDIAKEERDNTNRTLRAYLAETDWYVTRLYETGKPVPVEVVTKRADARANITD